MQQSCISFYWKKGYLCLLMCITFEKIKFLSHRNRIFTNLHISWYTYNPDICSIIFISMFLNKVKKGYICLCMFMTLLKIRFFLHTVWCNQMGTGFAQMSSWPALTWYTVIKTAFKTKNRKRESFCIFII